MMSLYTRLVTGALICSCTFLFADSKTGIVAKESKIPQNSQATAKNVSRVETLSPNYKAFTGKVVGNSVRLRLQADVESSIVKELPRDSLVVILGEKADFYAVEPPTEMKLYVFRSFVLDSVIEGNRVNVRLAPDLTSPIVGYLNTGDKVIGNISAKNHKWLEIAPPSSVHFFVAKEYIERVGGPELKQTEDNKRAKVGQLLESADLFGMSEMMKPFEEIDFDRVAANYNEIINDYSEFVTKVDLAKQKLFKLQETYLQKKLAYLESRATKMSREINESGTKVSTLENNDLLLTPKDRMKIWERVEESHFLAWAAKHHQKTMDDFYEEQKIKATRISGILESYNDPVKNKPGSFIIRDRDMPKAYLYSTFVDLHNYSGKYVTLLVARRPNNNFAFPAYFVISVE